ncbi:MAG: sugar phosphate isomerase/epimerase [Bacteriovoracaceae bacterium]|nr:sugar phosphate isomerase/epimerase [Bacteriovoracaceae bacterium]
MSYGNLLTLFTGQWADMPLAELAPKAKKWGYEGLEVACSGDHIVAEKAAKDKGYAEERVELLRKNGLQVQAISNHLAGQLVGDPNDDPRTDCFAPSKYHGNAEGKRQWAIDQMMMTAHAAKNMGVKIVTGFTGSPIWHMIYSFPPVTDQMIEDGYVRFATLWKPILDEFDKCDVNFALEVHPTEIAFDIVTAHKALKAINFHKRFGFNFDPSHLYWQMMDPVRFLQEFPDRIFHVHLKDALRMLDGKAGILGSHLNFGTLGRGWDFRSLGRGGIDFEAIIRQLVGMGYKGPLSVEWEDAQMDREFGAAEACQFAQKLLFPKSDRIFDEAFTNKN